MYEALKQIYADLKTDGNEEVIKHLVIDRVDYCTYGNTHPFRIRIVNRVNDNFDYFYIKIADASRVYGLELEHILSPNRINYVTCDNTLVEEHIAGVPGDAFLKQDLETDLESPIRLAKEFVKFNERCFVRLLGEPGRVAEVHFLEPVAASEDGRRRMADTCRARIIAAMAG